jgi:hypothetical protein
VQQWVNQVSGLLHAWWPGQNGGQALAEILFGNASALESAPFVLRRTGTWLSAKLFRDVTVKTSLASHSFL